MVANRARAKEKIIKLNTMDSENIKAIEEMRNKNDKAMTEKADLESKLKRFRWINEKALNKLENSSGQVASFHIKLKGLNNYNHQFQQENAYLMERLGQFLIREAKLRDELMTTQSEKNEILVKVKGIQKKIAPITTDLTRMKSVEEKQEIARLPEELKLTKISVEDLQVEEKTMS